MEQEQIDERMLKGGVVPVSDEVHRLPTAANGARKFKPLADALKWLVQPINDFWQ